MRVPSIAKSQPNERVSYCVFPVWISNKLEETPGYPQPVPKSRPPDLFHVKSAPGMDLGVFAKHDIKVHKLVFAERPLVVYPSATLYAKGLTEGDATKPSSSRRQNFLSTPRFLPNRLLPKVVTRLNLAKCLVLNFKDHFQRIIFLDSGYTVNHEFVKS